MLQIYTYVIIIINTINYDILYIFTCEIEIEDTHLEGYGVL